MKTDLNSLKADLLKLTDVDYLKTELSKMTEELKKSVDLKSHLSPQAKSRLREVEKRLNEARKKIATLQKQVDGEVGKVMVALRKTREQTERRLREVLPAGLPAGGARKKKTSKKATGKSTTRKASTRKTATGKSTSRKTSGK